MELLKRTTFTGSYWNIFCAENEARSSDQPTLSCSSVVLLYLVTLVSFNALRERQPIEGTLKDGFNVLWTNGACSIVIHARCQTNLTVLLHGISGHGYNIGAVRRAKV